MSVINYDYDSSNGILRSNSQDFLGNNSILYEINPLTGLGAPVGPVGHLTTGLASVPEPSSLILAALGLIGFAAWRWRRKLEYSRRMAGIQATPTR